VRPLGEVEDGRGHGALARLELDEMHAPAASGTAMAELDVPKSIAQKGEGIHAKCRPWGQP
jgi:hypothetical protein